MTDSDLNEVKQLNKSLRISLETPNFGLKSVNLGKNSVVIAFFCWWEFFAGNPDMIQQLCILVTSIDRTGGFNIMYCVSTNAKRVVRSVLAAELFSMMPDSIWLQKYVWDWMLFWNDLLMSTLRWIKGPLWQYGKYQLYSREEFTYWPFHVKAIIR